MSTEVLVALAVPAIVALPIVWLNFRGRQL